jgi:hypothetical protein
MDRDSPRRRVVPSAKQLYAICGNHAKKEAHHRLRHRLKRLFKRFCLSG